MEEVVVPVEWTDGNLTFSLSLLLGGCCMVSPSLAVLLRYRTPYYRMASVSQLSYDCGQPAT